MKGNSLILLLLNLLFLFGFQSCQKHILSKPIPFDKVLGNYEIKYNEIYKNRISLYSDSTYCHQIQQNDSVVLEEFGYWKYEQYTNFNIVILYNYTSFKDRVITKKAYFYACKRWNGITLSNNINADPDGSPMPPRYNKIIEH